jgi:hypothetical protein
LVEEGPQPIKGGDRGKGFASGEIIIVGLKTYAEAW